MQVWSTSVTAYSKKLARDSDSGKWLCFKLKELILADMLSRDDESGE